MPSKKKKILAFSTRLLCPTYFCANRSFWNRSISKNRLSPSQWLLCPQLTRTSSVLDVNDFVRSVDRFTPGRSFLVHNDSTSMVPWRFYRPAYLMDNYWWDKYYYFSPLYRGTQPYKNHYARQTVGEGQNLALAF